MTTKLIKVDGYWIVVSDENVKENDLIYYEKTIGKLVFSSDDLGQGYDIEIGQGVSYPIYEPLNVLRKILFSQNPEHNLPNITFSDEVAKELGIVDVEKLAYNFCDNIVKPKDVTRSLHYSYKSGYNQCLSDNADKRFTLEDMMNLAGYCAAMDNRRPIENLKEEAEYYIQSLTKEEYFCDELEMEEKCCGLLKDMVKGSDLTEGCKYCSCRGNKQPKITNNSIFVKSIWK